MIIDTKTMLRPFMQCSDDELQSARELIIVEQEKRAKEKLHAGLFATPTVEEKKLFATARFKAIRAYQDRTDPNMPALTARMIMEHHCGGSH